MTDSNKTPNCDPFDPLALCDLFEEIESTERVNHPQHYISGGLEAIDVIEAFTSDLNGPEAFCAGNALKYICRYSKKGGIEDIRKAIWYLKRLIHEINPNYDIEGETK